MTYTTKTQRMKGALQGIFIGSAAAVADRIASHYGSDSLLINLGLGTGIGALAGTAFPQATSVAYLIVNKATEIGYKAVKGIAKLSYKIVKNRLNEKVSGSKLENLTEESQ